MKTEELTALGLTEEQATKVLALNGLSVEKHKKRAETLESEKSDLESRLKTAEDTLKSFEGIDPQKIQQELDGYKKKADDAEKNFKAQMKARDQKDWLKTQFDNYGVGSPYARRQLEADCMSEDGLKWDEKGKSFFGFDDFMKSAKEKVNGLYQTKEEKEAAEKEAQAYLFGKLVVLFLFRLFFYSPFSYTIHMHFSIYLSMSNASRPLSFLR